MICSRNLTGSRLRSASVASAIGPVALVSDQIDEGAQAVLGAAGEAHRRIVARKP